MTKSEIVKKTDKLLAPRSCDSCGKNLTWADPTLEILTLAKQTYLFCAKCITQSFLRLSQRKDLSPSEVELMGNMRRFLNKLKKTARA